MKDVGAEDGLRVANPATPAARILIVDDDEQVAAALIRLLQRNGYTSTRASNAQEALQLLDQGPFDVALVDVVMPVIQGPELIPLLNAKQPNLQVIMMSGSGTVDIAVRSLTGGAMDFIEKPAKPGVVLRSVERAVRNAEIDRTTALYRASQTIFDAQHFERLPQAIVNVAMQVMSADTASLLLPSPDGQLCVAHAHGLNAEVQNTVRITIGQGIAGRVAASGKPTIINGSATRTAEFADATPRDHIKSSIVYPLVSGTRLVGMITFNRLRDERPYRQADLDQASVLASQVMLALENRRLARQTAISEKLAAVGQLAAGVAHELNTPIQFVGDGLHFLGSALDDLLTLTSAYESLRMEQAELGNTALFEKAVEIETQIDLADLRVEIPRALQRTREGIQRVTSIVRSIKTFGRPDTVAKESTDLVKLIEATLMVARGEYKYVAEVETRFDELPFVPVHPGELGQVVLNLVVNAAHAIADKATTDTPASRGTITITARIEGACAVISIADTGCGIPPDIQKKIFDPFFTTKAIGRGTGLGLSIARGIIVDKHGGELIVESVVGIGSVFHIRLPVAE
jgi:two-component system NtrC family sensor kinase